MFVEFGILNSIDKPLKLDDNISALFFLLCSSVKSKAGYIS